MTLEQVIYDVLNTAGLGAPLYYDEAPPAQKTPYVVYGYITTEDQLATFGEANATVTTRRYQVTCVGGTALEVEQLRQAVRAGLSGAPDATGQLQAAIPDTETAMKDPVTQRHIRTVDFIITGACA
jgi:hypothetical protein